VGLNTAERIGVVVVTALAIFLMSRFEQKSKKEYQQPCWSQWMTINEEGVFADENNRHWNGTEACTDYSRIENGT